MLSSFSSACAFVPSSPQYQYKKNYEKSKGHYHTIPDNLEQLHLKEATELQSIVSQSRLFPDVRSATVSKMFINAP